MWRSMKHNACNTCMTVNCSHCECFMRKSLRALKGISLTSLFHAEGWMRVPPSHYQTCQGSQMIIHCTSFMFKSISFFFKRDACYFKVFFCFFFFNSFNLDGPSVQPRSQVSSVNRPISCDKSLRLYIMVATFSSVFCLKDYFITMIYAKEMKRGWECLNTGQRSPYYPVLYW